MIKSSLIYGKHTATTSGHGLICFYSFSVLPGHDEQPDSPSDPTYQATGDLAADFPDISPRELPGNPTGGGAGEYRHQKHQQARVIYQAQERSDQCSHRASDWHRNGYFPNLDAEEPPNALHALDPSGSAQEHPENHHQHGRQ
jgi:hypothetical protein